MYLPFQKVNKNIVWKRPIDWEDTKYFKVYKGFLIFSGASSLKLFRAG